MFLRRLGRNNTECATTACGDRYGAMGACPDNLDSQAFKRVQCFLVRVTVAVVLACLPE